MAVPVTLKVSAFALVVMGFYTWYSNSIPQIESKPPEELFLEGGQVTPEQLVSAGEKTFREEGQGTARHGPRGGAGRVSRAGAPAWPATRRGASGRARSAPTSPTSRAARRSTTSWPRSSTRRPRAWGRGTRPAGC